MRAWWNFRGRPLTAGIVTLLALAAILVDGYHPYSEDAGIYVASLKWLAHPDLFPASGAFLAPYVHLSLFSHFGAWLLRELHLPLEAVLLVMHFATTWLFAYASHRLAMRCFSRPEGHWGGTLLSILCLSVPVAGTSLSIMDPYLTGRSFSTPFALLAFCAMLERSHWRVFAFLLLASLFHPLMGGYATGFVLMLWAVQRRSWIGVGLVALASLLSAALLQFSQISNAGSAAYRAAVATRSYFFLSEWRWYELLGLAAPVVLLMLYGLWLRRRGDTRPAELALASAATGLISVIVSLLFCHLSYHSYKVAALQPLRPFLFVYCILFVLLGGLLGELLCKRSAWKWIGLTLPLGIGLGFVQHSVYPDSPHLELPWIASRNPWHRAFEWVRLHTPADAVVALDADYIGAPSEDSLGFRAVAERDSLADASKDGGAAAVFPELADRWWRERTATIGLNLVGDAERLVRLRPFHVTWIVLSGNAPTAFPCPFATPAVKVCQLR